MARPDLNQLVTLDVLLTEGSVAKAARRMQLSPSAMSRALARLRETVGDPLLVRAGRSLVPTPRAIALREEVQQLVLDAEAVLRPAEQLDLEKLARTFAIRASDGFAESFGPALIERIGRDAPGVRLRFVRKLDRDSTALREGSIDLETGVVGGNSGPEIRTQLLFRDQFVGVVRQDHPLVSGKAKRAAYSNGRHILVSRDGKSSGPVDETLREAGLKREIVASVDGYATALMLVRSSELIASVPERHTEPLRVGLHTFALPVKMPPLAISLMWHPRQDADPGHRWLRGCLHDACVVSRTKE